MNARQVPSATFTTGFRHTLRPSFFASRIAQRTSSSVTVGSASNGISVDWAVACSAPNEMPTQLTLSSPSLPIESAAAEVAQVPRTPVQPQVIPQNCSMFASTGADTPLIGRP